MKIDPSYDLGYHPGSMKLPSILGEPGENQSPRVLRHRMILHDPTFGQLLWHPISTNHHQLMKELLRKKSHDKRMVVLKNHPEMVVQDFATIHRYGRKPTVSLGIIFFRELP